MDDGCLGTRDKCEHRRNIERFCVSELRTCLILASTSVNSRSLFVESSKTNSAAWQRYRGHYFGLCRQSPGILSVAVCCCCLLPSDALHEASPAPRRDARSMLNNGRKGNTWQQVATKKRKMSRDSRRKSNNANGRIELHFATTVASS